MLALSASIIPLPTSLKILTVIFVTKLRVLELIVGQSLKADPTLYLVLRNGQTLSQGITRI